MEGCFSQKKLVLFGEPGDFALSKVIEWLNYYNVPFIRLDYFENEINFLVSNGNSDEFDVKIFAGKHNFTLSEVNVIWFRRGMFNVHNIPDYSHFIEKNSGYKKFIDKHLRKENETLFNFIYSKLSDKCINNPLGYNVNKLSVLELAKKKGISIPKTLISSSRETVQEFFQNTNELITKAISDVVFIEHKNFFQSHTVKPIKYKALKNLSSQFHYSLFQEALDIKWEIRTFYFLGYFFSLAKIMKGSKKYNSKLSVDGNILRLEPFKLPAELEKKLDELMKELKLKSGSIDMIYTKSKQFYFLEVNPVGQYDYVSFYGNYHIEKFIANRLASL